MLKRLNLFVLLCFFTLIGCNKNLTEDEKEALWERAQTTGEIINRSGTKFNSAVNKDLAMRDAETRLSTGGGLFGKNGIDVMGVINQNERSDSVVGVGMPINPYLWKASIETISFMPLSSADPFGGTIITDWYLTESNLDERCKLNIFVNGKDLKTDNLKVLSFCQKLKNNQWVNIQSDEENNFKIENAILNKAKKLKLTSG